MVQRITIRPQEDVVSVIDDTTVYYDTLENFETDFGETLPTLTSITILQHDYGTSTVRITTPTETLYQSGYEGWTASEMDTTIEGLSAAITARGVRENTAAAQAYAAWDSFVTAMSAYDWDYQFVETILTTFWVNSSYGGTGGLAAMVMSLFQLGTNPYKQKFYDLCGQYGAGINGSTTASALVGNQAAQSAILNAGTILMLHIVMAKILEMDGVVRVAVTEAGTPNLNTPLPTV